MKYTVESIAKATGLAGSTIQRYAWSMKLGKIEGKRKVFTEAEAKKLSTMKDGSGRAARRRKPVSAKRATKPQPKKVSPSVVKKETPIAELKTLPAEKRSFWSFLGVGTKPKAKVSLVATK